MSPGVRYRPALLVVMLLAVGMFSPASPLVEHTSPDGRTIEDVRFVRLDGEESTLLWPYTSRGRSFDQATLPINLLVHDDAATVYWLLVSTPEDQQLYWNSSSEEWRPGDPVRGNVTINGTGVYWAESSGSDRYTFMMDGGSRTWTDATYQIHDGSYFGSRYHLRLYEGGAGKSTWTAIQAHREYWNWFRLRHEVVSLSRAQHHVERDFLGTGLVTEMERNRWANGGAVDADGWVTVIKLQHRVITGPDRLTPGSWSGRPGLVVPLLGLAATAYLTEALPTGREYVERLRRSRLTRLRVMLFVSTALFPLIVRVGAIAVERAVPGASPTVVGGPFYLLLVLGLPGAALLIGRHLRPAEGFSLSVLGMGTGVMADYAYLGLTVISFDVLVQNLVLLFGLGLIGAGGSRWSSRPLTRHRYHALGAAIWVGALLWPLLGLG